MAASRTAIPPVGSDPAPASSAAGVLARCDLLGRISDEPDRLTRVYGFTALRAAQDVVAAWMVEAGMSVRRDPIGNLIGRLDGAGPDQPAILLGSHLDTVRDAGKYDGPLGVLVAIAAIERLGAMGRVPAVPVEIVAFADEEGVRFHTTLLGSRALAGTLSENDLARADAGGITLRDAISAFGGDPNHLGDCRRIDRPAAYVEVHIEQGPVLESLDLPVGVVTGIAGQSRISVAFHGRAGHAGTVPMHARTDALTGAAEFVLAIERLARGTEDLVATVGTLSIHPGASNVIPGEVRLSVDIRHPDDHVRSEAVFAAERLAQEIADGRSLRCAWDMVQSSPVIPCSERLTLDITHAVEALGLSAPRLTSGAGHDAIAMSAVAPIGMLFIRCAGGISHHPDEHVTEADVAVAIDAVTNYLIAQMGSIVE